PCRDVAGYERGQCLAAWKRVVSRNRQTRSLKEDTVTSVLTVVGQGDPKLEGLVRASGRVTTVIWLADLTSLLDPKASQPDVVLIDIRRASTVPSQLATL